LTRKSASVDKVCGNCRCHNTYEYPYNVFCFTKFADRENPVVSIFDGCDKWENKLQDCFCVEDALKKQGKKKK